MIRAIVTVTDEAYYTEGNGDLGEVEEARESHSCDRIELEQLAPREAFSGPWGVMIYWAGPAGRFWLPGPQIRSISLSTQAKVEFG